MVQKPLFSKSATEPKEMELEVNRRVFIISSLLVSFFLLHVPATEAASARMLSASPTHRPPRLTETCSAAPKEFIDRLLNARRQDCERIAAECKVVAISRGVSETNCEDCKRKCLNRPDQITETCSAAPREFIDLLLHAKREDCERIAADCKKVAVYRGISETNCEACKRQCLKPSSSPSPPAPSRVTETCSAAPKEFIDRLLNARRQDCERIAAECKLVAVSRGISETNCEDCKRKCLNPPHQITETCSAAPREFIYLLLHAKRQDCERIAADCKKVAVDRGISETNCEACKRKCLNP